MPAQIFNGFFSELPQQGVSQKFLKKFFSFHRICLQNPEKYDIIKFTPYSGYGGNIWKKITI